MVTINPNPKLEPYSLETKGIADSIVFAIITRTHRVPFMKLLEERMRDVILENDMRRSISLIRLRLREILIPHIKECGGDKHDATLELHTMAVTSWLIDAIAFARVAMKLPNNG